MENIVTNALISALSDALNREGQTVTLHSYTRPLPNDMSIPTEYTVLFRKKSDSTKNQDIMLMYHPQEYNFRMGTIVDVKGVPYILLNCENIEGSEYYKSAIQKCNATINTARVWNLPCFGDSINDAKKAEEGKNFAIDGSVEIITIDNAQSRKLKINDTFELWGRRFEVTNIYYIDGMTRIMIEVTGDADIVIDQRVEIEPINELVRVGNIVNLIAKAKCDGVTETATLTYSSSNESVATISDTGKITYIGSGTVYFTVTWVETNLSASTPMITVEPIFATQDGYDLVFETISDVYDGFTNEVKYYVTNGGQIVEDSTNIDFSVEEGYKGITLEKASGNILKITIDNDDIIRKTITIKAVNEQLEIDSELELTVQSYFS